MENRPPQGGGRRQTGKGRGGGRAMFRGRDREGLEGGGGGGRGGQARDPREI